MQCFMYVLFTLQIIIGNGPAKAEKVGESIQKAGEEFGDMFEVSTLRREV